MDKKVSKRLVSLLIAGDSLTLALVTFIGFATHGTAGSAGFRMFTTYLPLLLSWFAISPYLRLFNSSDIRDFRQLWRPIWAMILAAPLASWLRGVWLESPILPVFVAVLGGVSALGLLIWRGLFIFILRWKST